MTAAVLAAMFCELRAPHKRAKFDKAILQNKHDVGISIDLSSASLACVSGGLFLFLIAVPLSSFNFWRYYSVGASSQLDTTSDLARDKSAVKAAEKKRAAIDALRRKRSLAIVYSSCAQPCL